MVKKLSKILLTASILCIAVYIGIFIGRITTKDMLHFSDFMQTQPEKSTKLPDIQKLDLNDASIQDLTDIPGISFSVAEAIIEYRNEFGRFYRIRELLEIDGVTEELYQTIKKYVTVSD